jgi:hypothetical protein
VADPDLKVTAGAMQPARLLRLTNQALVHVGETMTAPDGRPFVSQLNAAG